ncbi:MAG TPA: hypothetical protein VFW66_05420 [Gemmatimonadales bacterium]|nr:hypothetical protein [Gemmatimonadales bacterium]
MSSREPAPTALGAWLDRHSARAPAPLGARIRVFAGAASENAAGGKPGGTAEPRALPALLAHAASEALARVLAHPGDRSAALDLLAADALVTLALLAQAQQAPAELAQFADGLIRAGLAMSAPSA